MAELHDKLQAALAKTGIPHKRIHVYGSQIVITCWSEDAALKFVDVLSQMKLRTVRQVTKSRETNKENNGTCLLPSSHYVWMASAVI